jgi:alpha-beta hydrolase superfamily lysophospholipase
MIRAELHQIQTADGIPLSGLFFRPPRKGRLAAVWLGGLTSHLGGSPTRTNVLGRAFTRAGVAFAIFNHRGFGMMNMVTVKKKKKLHIRIVGTSVEKFEECVLDLQAIIRFLRQQGYSHVFLFGHSTGAGKSAYYLWKKGGVGLSGVGLLGPLRDVPGFRERLGRKYPRALKQARGMISRGHGDEFLPTSLTRGEYWTAQRFWSIARAGSREDAFPYGKADKTFYWVRRIRKPILVLIGENDQYADRPTSAILQTFQDQIPPRWYTGILLPNADHSFSGQEFLLARRLLQWMRSVSLKHRK